MSCNFNDSNSVKHEISTKIKFSIITTLLERIYKATSINRKCEILKSYIESFNEFSKSFKDQLGNNCNTSFYPIFRLLLPSADRERDSYGIKTTTMGKLYVRVLAIDPNGEVAKKLTLKQGSNKASTDYAEVVFEVMQNRCSSTSEITVYEVNQHLDLIAECYQNNNRKKIDDELIKMINGMTAIDQKWLIRIILKKMNFGLGQQKLMTAYHPSAKDFYAQYSHLSRVCECIENGEIIQPKGTVEPFQPFRPMLCQRINIGNLQEIITNKEFYLETKMDGERFQIHIKDEEYKYFSRNGYDFTHTYGANVTEGTLTPFINHLFKIKIKNIILDGEMMVWNKDELIYHTKGENFDVKSIKKNDSTLRPCFCVYDILFLNDVCLTNKPYGERIRLLGTIFREQQGYLALCGYTKIRDSTHILECLNTAIDQKEEGVVIKDSDSLYAPGERNAGWCKIKPDYIDGLVSDFDLVIIGGYYNRRKTYIHNFLLGVFRKTNDENDEGTYYATTRVSLGLTYAQSREINTTLKPHWILCQTSREGRTTITHNPPGIELGLSSPDVWIDPKKSIVLEVKASELVKSTSFGTNYTLRFPRIVSIRSDKSWYDCCSLDEFNKLCSSNTKVEKITKRHITSSDINEPRLPPKRSRQKVLKAISHSISDYSEADITRIDNICDGLDFCVLTTAPNMPPLDELKKIIISHGGRIVQNPSNKTFVCIAGIQSLRVSKMIETKTFNIATVDWLIRALGGDEVRNELLEFHPRDMLSITINLEDEFAIKFDVFGDSFTKKVEPNQLKTILDKINIKDLPTFNRSELYKMEVELYENKKPKNIYRLATGYFYSNFEDNKMALAKIIFKSKGGKCVEHIDENHNLSYKISHVFVNSDKFDFEEFRNLNIFSQEDFDTLKVVSCQWIIDCNNEGRKISDKIYLYTY